MRIRIRQDKLEATGDPAYIEAVRRVAESSDETWLRIDHQTLNALKRKHGRGSVPTFPVGNEPPNPKPKKLQPGDLLAKAIKAVTGSDGGYGCNCKARRRQMNQWGWWGCWRNRATIAAWLADEAGKRGHDVKPGEALSYIRAAWREVRAKP